MTNEILDDVKCAERMLSETHINNDGHGPCSSTSPDGCENLQSVKIKFHYEQGCKILSFKLPLQWEHFYERIRNFNPSPNFIIQRRSADGKLGKQICNQEDLNTYLHCAEDGKLRVEITSLTAVPSSRLPATSQITISTSNGPVFAASEISHSPNTNNSFESGVDSISGRSCTDFNVIRRNMIELRRRKYSGNSSSIHDDMRWTDYIANKNSGHSKCSSPMMTQYDENALGGAKASTYPKRTAPIPKGKDGINSLPRHHTPEENSHKKLYNQNIYTSTCPQGVGIITRNNSDFSITPQHSNSRWDRQSMGSLSRASSTSSCLSTDSSCPWQRGTLLGRGSFGVVYQCMDRQTGMEFAIKEILLTNSTANQNSSSQHSTPLHQTQQQQVGFSHVRCQQQLSCTSELEAEMEVLRSLDHLRIVRYFGVLRTQRALYVCMEYLPEGSLYRKLHTFGPLAEPVVRNYTKQILEGLAFLHQMMIVHRDLKAANILCDRGELKLADFGTAVHLNRLQRMMDSRSFCGTPYWMSPELLRPSKTELQGFSLDSWSLGATVIEMLTGNPPYYQMEVFHAAFEIRERGIPKELWPLDICPSVESFLSETFQMNSQQRPIAADLLLHEFVQYEDHMLLQLENEYHPVLDLI